MEPPGWIMELRVHGSVTNSEGRQPLAELTSSGTFPLSCGVGSCLFPLTSTLLIDTKLTVFLSNFSERSSWLWRSL